MMDTSVKHFTSASTGGPTYTSTLGSVIAIFDACLVNGFGLKSVDSVSISGGVGVASISTGHAAKAHSVVEFSGAANPLVNGEKKVISVTLTTVTFDAAGIPDQTEGAGVTMKLAAAGWEKVFSATNKAVYRSRDPYSSRLYLRVDDTASAYTTVCGYEAMTGIDSGTGQFPLGLGYRYIPRPQYGSWQAAWWIAADTKTIYFGHAPIQEYPAEFAISLIGDIASVRPDDAYAFIFAANYNPSAASASAEWTMAFTSRTDTNFAPLARPYSQLGAAVNTISSFKALGTVLSGRGGLSFPNLADNSLRLDTFSVIETGTYSVRGSYRGVLACTQNAGSAMTNDSEISGVEGFPSRTFIWKALTSGTVGSPGGLVVDVTGPWE